MISLKIIALKWALSVITVNLYTTAACHLCEQAEALLATLQQDNAQLNQDSVQLNKVQLAIIAIDIADSDALVAQYGIRIPVLQRSDTLAELNWPFTRQDIEQFLSA